ncbi:MAG: valyl-tRNA synthetase ValS [Candidatus Peregrinibacteria bacterium Greene0416_19]|nr:MAG: valyl-tRNA synthetase ValS [Candidatus Peregrinibacteria bacterium Greene0416_19]
MLPKSYDPLATEDRVYAMWEESGAFMADAESRKEPFTISLPPPNATGNLHLGHAVMLAIEDIFIRFARMRGREALWVPGTDHAAIATESVVIKQIQKEEKMPDPRGKLGREELLRRIAEFVERSKATIRGQVRKMGASCDWSRERYTLEPALNRIVNEMFTRMYWDGLIYRGHRIVNWDPILQTTVSDDEIVWQEERAPFYWFQYGPFQIGTSRPETKFGDKYVVTHPDDDRYKKYKHGETFTAEWINGPVTATVIKDKAVDPSFGTGVMTITPWHDMADFEIAERHDLKKEQIIGFDGKLLPIAGEFAGMHIDDARPKVVEKLRSKGLLVTTEQEYVHNVSLSQRGKGKIEPQIKEQWFIDVNKRVVKWKRKELSLKEVMQEVVKTGQIKIIPERFEKIYFHWIDNLRDWCISRQIWWGHRVPVWYRSEGGNIDTHVGIESPKGDGWEQDPDTLDTWFSSALWTWSTLVDPKLALDLSVPFEDLLLKSPDFMKFHPTQVLETGYDILFFWVARMILMTTYATGGMAELEYGHVPFETVYLHGLIRTRDGRKMSKSDPDTMIDPLDMIGKYGADALRLSMIVGQSPGADSRLYEEKIAGYRNFVNKLWNASRFVLLQCEQAGIDPRSITQLPKGAQLSLADRALLHALECLIEDVSDGLTHYRLSEVGERLYSFVWDYFCDWYLELSKGSANHAVLVHALRRILKLLHPYCPFVTEELWASVKPKDAGMLIKEEWPIPKAERKDPEAFHRLQTVIDVITAIRKLRADQGVEPSTFVHIIIHTDKHLDLLQSQREHIMRLGRCDQWTLDAVSKKHKNVVSAFLNGIEVHLSLEGLIDVEKERASLEKEKKNLSRLLESMHVKLKNEQFLAKAPASVIEVEKEKAQSIEEKLKKIEKRLNQLD